VVVILLGALTPWLVNEEYFTHVLTLALIYVVLAMSLQLLLGYAGQLSLGHAAFFGVGAYTSAACSAQLKMPVPVAIVCGVALAGALGAVVAPISRLRGNYLAVGTLGLVEIVHTVFLNWTPVTHGTEGYLNIPAFSFFGYLPLETDFHYYYVVFALTVVVYLSFRQLVENSRFGQSLAAIRQNELAAAAVGVNARFYKMQVFILSSAAAGLAGGLFAHFIRYLSPNQFTLDVSIAVLMMIVVGGIGSLNGAVVGALLLSFAPEYLRQFQEFRLVIYGVLILVLMIFVPSGLAGLWRRGLRAVRRSRGNTGSATPVAVRSP